MKKLFIILFSLVCFTSFGFAQWSMGLSVGPDYSHYNYDVQWAYDFRLKSYWGVAMEVPLSYAVNDWFSIKSGVSFQERGYCLLRSHQYSKYSELNRQDLFLSLPIEAVFSFGGRKLKGFFNAGGYVSYWLCSKYYGYELSATLFSQLFSEDKEFEKGVDNRLELGCVGGIGIDYAYSEQWSFIADVQLYYALSDQHKDYQSMRFPANYRNFLFQMGLVYHFKKSKV